MSERVFRYTVGGKVIERVLRGEQLPWDGDYEEPRQIKPRHAVPRPEPLPLPKPREPYVESDAFKASMRFAWWAIMILAGTMLLFRF